MLDMGNLLLYKCFCYINDLDIQLNTNLQNLGLLIFQIFFKIDLANCFQKFPDSNILQLYAGWEPPHNLIVCLPTSVL